MNIISGSQYRNFAAQNEFNFLFSVTNSTSSGVSNLGFSGATGESINIFKFESGQIFDLNNRYIWGYNPRESVDISGNIGPGYINYFINNTPVCLYSPCGTGYYDNFYINTQNSTVDFDFYINGTLPNYSFEYDTSLEILENITGYIKNNSSAIERSFKIFSGQIFNTNFEYSLYSFNSGLISGGRSGQFLLKPANVSATEVTPANLTLLLYTNFGTITQDISFNIYPSPIYFTDFITGYTGLLGLKDDFTLEKLYNFELDSIYPTDRDVSFILENISGHTGQKIYGEFAASGFVSGKLSKFIYGFDYITGNVFGTGTSINQKDYYGEYPTVSFNTNLSIQQNATGDIIYNYTLPIYGGYGTGSAPSGISITGSGYLTGLEIFTGFVYGAQTLYNKKNVNLTGYYGQVNSINIKTGLSDIYLPTPFTGSGYIDYSKFLWSCSFVTGTGYFSGEIFSGASDKIIGITGTRYFNIDSGSSGIFYFDTTVFRDQTGAEVLIPLIGQNTGLFNNSGRAYGYYGPSLNVVNNIFSGDNINAAITGSDYFYFDPATGGYCGFIFSFDGYESQNRGTIKYMSFELDRNALYAPGANLRLQFETGNYNESWDSASHLTSVNFSTLSNDSKYNSSNNTYYFKNNFESNTYPNGLNVNNSYKRVKLLVNCGTPSVWPHQNIENEDLIKAIGIKNFQVYRSIPVKQLSGLSYLKYPINTNNMTGYSTPSNNLLSLRSYSGTVIASQDTLTNPAWYAFNSNKNLYPYADIIEDFDGQTTVGYALNNPIRKLFSGFAVEFVDAPSTPTYIGVEVSQDGTNYYECYNKTSGIQLSETGSFKVGTGYKYFRLNLTPLPSCVYAPYSDACYQKTITQYPSCCSTVWDNTCEMAYRGCTGAFPPGVDPPIYQIIYLYPFNGILGASATSSAVNSPYSIMINGSGRPQVWGGSVEQFTESTSSVISTIPANATGLKNIYAPWPESTASGVVFAIGCTGNLIMWGNTSAANIGSIPANLGPIKKVVYNSYGGALILKENNRITGLGIAATPIPYAGWTGMINILKDTDVVDISAGYAHYLALLSNGSVCAWGYDPVPGGSYPERHITSMPSIGVNYSGMSVVTNFAAVSGLNNILGIAAGDQYSLLISGDNRILTGWGIGRTTSAVNYYNQIPMPSITDVKSISAGRFHAMAIYSDKLQFTGWGVETGLTNTQNFGQNVIKWSPTTGIYSIAAGKYHSLALRQTGQGYDVVRWGEGSGTAKADNATGLYTIKPILTGYLSGNKYC